jgi:hypothetical protein
MLSSYSRELIASVVTNQTSMPSLWYMALLTQLPLSTDSGSALHEPTDTAYSRIAIGTGSTNWTVPSAGEVVCKTSIEWDAATADWGTLVAWALCDAAASGNILFYGSLSVPVVVTDGKVVSMTPYSLHLYLEDVQ